MFINSYLVVQDAIDLLTYLLIEYFNYQRATSGGKLTIVIAVSVCVVKFRLVECGTREVLECCTRV